MRIDISNLEFIDPKLREIAFEVEKHFRVEFTVTSLYRIGDPGVHGTMPLRGMDLRCSDLHLGLLVKDFVNTHWAYDPDREEKDCALFGDPRHLDHIHLQTHPNTVRIITP